MADTRRQIDSTRLHPGSEQAALTAQMTQLELLLQQQIEMARLGDMTSIENSCEKAARLVETMGPVDFEAHPELEVRRTRLRRLYRDLALALNARKQAVNAELTRLRKTRKAFKVYRNNV